MRDFAAKVKNDKVILDLKELSMSMVMVKKRFLKSKNACKKWVKK